METKKISENEMEVTKESIVPEPSKVVYSIDFLKNQELEIIKSMNDFVEKRQEELNEIRILITEAEKLGLKTEAELRNDKIITESNKLEENIN